MAEEEVNNAESGYTVVARRYRPRTFEQLIGQDHIAQALGQAIHLGRVGHAYLFTGARGVGKTSTARIFAKALNTTGAEAADEIAQAIDAGEDMDVIEIDGASNRGIEEIRQLRANVNVRPSRSAYKIYIIDEVHMLTNQAFNALLKTLEEPPPHVKFIFCTTDPDKIPITVLSRCQRFDFAPVKLEAIQGRLQEIAVAEGYEADNEALALLARRAAGSMRDSQSLLEQVMSFADGTITVEQVHALLGTADESRLILFVEALIARDALSAIKEIDEAVRAGSDAGQLAEQLLAYFRDMMTAAIGGGPELLKLANPANHEKVKSLAEQWGTETILSAMQIMDESLVRMRTSISAVTLLEVALVQICGLEQLASIPDLLERLTNASGLPAPTAKPGSGGGPPQKKSSDLTEQPNSAADVVAPPAEPASTASLSDQLERGKAEQNASSGSQNQHASNAPGRTEELASEMPSKTSAGSSDSGGSIAPAAPPGPTNGADGSFESAVVHESTTAVAEAPPGQMEVREEKAVAVASPQPAARSMSQPAARQSTAGSGDALSQWKAAVGDIDGMIADIALMAERVEPQGSDSWKVVFAPGATQPKEYCEQAEKKAELQAALLAKLGRRIGLSFEAPPGQVVKRQASVSQSVLRAQKLREMSNHPYVKKLCEVLGGEIVRVDPPRTMLAGSRDGRPQTNQAGQN
ncbi:MAG: DNA polymerase III subunit gamma/tau [Planctomycetota bacterium]